jgi:hypothetical protein
MMMASAPETRRQPSRAEPPRYLQGADEYAPGFVAEDRTRSIGNDATGKHQGGNDDESKKLSQKARDSTLPLAKANE